MKAPRLSIPPCLTSQTHQRCRCCRLRRLRRYCRSPSLTSSVDILISPSSSNCSELTEEFSHSVLIKNIMLGESVARCDTGGVVKQHTGPIFFHLVYLQRVQSLADICAKVSVICCYPSLRKTQLTMNKPSEHSGFCILVRARRREVLAAQINHSFQAHNKLRGHFNARVYEIVP